MYAVRRIRTTGEKSAAITYKGAKLDKISMTRQELETTVGDARNLPEYIRAHRFSSGSFGRKAAAVLSQRKYHSVCRFGHGAWGLSGA